MDEESNEIVTDDTSNVTVDDTTGEVSGTENNESTSEPANGTEDVEYLKEQNKRLFERAKKAEGFVKDASGNWIKKPKPTTPEPKPVANEVAKTEVSVSLKDQIALINAKISEEDIDEVLDYAKFKGITVTEAIKSPVVQATIREKMEQRKTAEAVNTSGSKRVSNKVSDETIISQAEKGNLPEDVDMLIEARHNLKRRK